MHDVTCLGELLIDFTSLRRGASLIETPGFEKHAGGAPANVAVGVSRLGGSAAFLGMVGNDEFGQFLANTLTDHGVDIRGLRYSDLAHTTLAFVALREDGEREFIFYRNPGADMLYGPGDLDTTLVADGRILHHGSISFISAPNRDATLHAIATARASGRLISFDPNLRLNLWDNPIDAHAGLLLGLPTADILKLSVEELEFLTEQTDVYAGMRHLREQGVPVIVVTMSDGGCVYAWGAYTGHVPIRKHRHPIDTTGAGDAFMAGMLYWLTRLDVPPLDLGRDEIEGILDFANTVAGRVIGRRGAIPAMPTLEEVTEGM